MGAFNNLSMAFALKDQTMRTYAVNLKKELTPAQMTRSTTLIRFSIDSALIGGIFFAAVDGQASYSAFE